MLKKLLFISLLIMMTVSCEKDDEKKAEDPYKDLVGTLIRSDETWSGTLTKSGKFYILPGIKLTIQAGAVISFTYHDNDPDKVGAIITLKGDGTNASGQLIAQGTSSNPIVLTSARSSKAAGDWGGVVLIGEAPTNVGGTAFAEGDVEGLPQVVKYGGTKPADNSGILKYVRIEYVGFGIAADSELNGLSLYGVGNATTLEYIQVHKCTDDGYEFFGGTVNTKYLVSSYADDDSFDMDEGWNGKNQFWFGLQTSHADNGFESDGRKTLGQGTPTKPTLYNVTLVGFGSGKDSDDKNYGMRLREDFEGILANFIITNFDGISWKLESSGGDLTSANYNNGSLTIKNALLYNNAQTGSNHGTFSSSSDSTRFYATANKVSLSNPNFTNTSTKDYRPLAGSPALSDYLSITADGFFVQANYRGAFGDTNWMTGWTKFD